jgi:ribosomal protein L37AE/L43A
MFGNLFCRFGWHRKRIVNRKVPTGWTAGTQVQKCTRCHEEWNTMPQTVKVDRPDSEIAVCQNCGRHAMSYGSTPTEAVKSALDEGFNFVGEQLLCLECVQIRSKDPTQVVGQEAR